MRPWTPYIELQRMNEQDDFWVLTISEHNKGPNYFGEVAEVVVDVDGDREVDEIRNWRH